MLLLVALALTAIATTAAQLLPVEGDLDALALSLDLVPFGSVIVTTLVTSIRLRREHLPLVRSVIGIYSYFAGSLVGALGVAHLVAVALAPVSTGQRQFEYTFRLYSLVLLGVLLVASGVLAAVLAARLARGHRAAWSAAVTVWAASLAINLPLVPLQGFAVLFSALAALALLLLVGLRSRFDTRF